MGLEGLFQKPSQRVWSQGLGKSQTPDSAPCIATLPEESREGTEDGPLTKGSGTSYPSHFSCSCSLSPSPQSPAHHGLPPPLAGAPRAEPSTVSSLSEAGDSNGGSMSAEEEPVEGDPYEWVLI